MASSVKQTSAAKMESPSKKNIVEIYTDWANHYLEKTKGKHKIKNLQSELSDGLLLTEVIESVTHQKVPDIQRKPKTKDAMITNIQACLNFLLAKGVAVEEIRADEIHEGNMKAILGLFFQLSRYKQQQKQSVPASPARSGLSSIPVPGASPKKCNAGSQGPVTVRAHANIARTSAETGGLRPPSAGGKRLLQEPGHGGHSPQHQLAPKQSMLQKFKSNLPNSPRQAGLGKRTSSSSGFSSARSDRSESSSVSLSSDTNFPSPAALRRIQESEVIKQMAENTGNSNSNITASNSNCNNTSTRSSLRSKLTKPENYRLSREKSSSPKRSPKLGHRPVEIKDYGPIDADLSQPGTKIGSGSDCKLKNGDNKGRHYPPHAYTRSNSGVNLKHTNISSQPQSPAARKVNGGGMPSPVTGAGKPINNGSGGGGVSGIPSPRGKPPAPPVRRSSDLGSLEAPDVSEVTQSEDGGQPASVVTTSGSSVTNSYISRTCSLPRHKRMGDINPLSPAIVAVVSPMPHMTKSQSGFETRGREEEAKETSPGPRSGGEDPLRGIAPMAPLGPGVSSSRPNSGHRPGFSPYESHNIQTINTNGLSSSGGRAGDLGGYQSDGDLVRSRLGQGQVYGGSETYSEVSGYTSDNHYDRRAQRLAYEQQRARAEADHRKYLEMSGKVGGPQGSSKPTYKLSMGSRKNVKKSDSGIQTEVNPQLSGQQDHWRAAMEHNKAVLASQENEMKEYLKRQQRVAEKHIKQFSPALPRKNGVTALDHHGGAHHGGEYGALETMSMPGTPLGVRRGQAPASGDRGQTSLGGGQVTRGGSLERNKRAAEARGVSEAYSDTEYVQDQRLARMHGSKSLPKKSSALNYGLLLGQIQQKRQQRKTQKSIDGSVSDSNYGSYNNSSNSGNYTSYSDIQGMRGQGGKPGGSSQHYGGWASCAEENLGSNESLDSVSSSIKQARAHSLNRPKGELQETEYYGVPHMLQRGQEERARLTHSSLPSYTQGKQRIHSSELQPPEDVSGSHNSLLSNGSSVYSSQEDKTNAEIGKLKRELIDEHKKVINLTSQLATNAHVVSAFEQSLSNMTSRLHQITKTAEKKDSELAELRKTIDKLRQTGADAGLIKIVKKEEKHGLMRQESTGSVTSLTSALSSTSLNSGDEKEKGAKGGPKRSGWLRSSFSKAFAKHKTRHKSGSVSDCEDVRPDNVVSDDNKAEDNTGGPSDEEPEPEVISELKKQLIEKDTLLTETRLEALSSVHQLESLKETVNKMKTELTCLKQDNEKLQSQVITKSLGSSESSLNTNNTDPEVSDKRSSVGPLLSTDSSSMMGGQPSSLDMSVTTDPSNTDSKSVAINVSLSKGGAIQIGTIAASGRLGWALLDGLVERLFSEWLMLVDPVTNLGLAAESVKSYLIGDLERKLHDNEEPELLPYGYIIGEIRTIELKLGDTLDCLAFETLIPRSVMLRYVALLREHKHVIISGPGGCGKSGIAARLGAAMVTSSDKVERLSLSGQPMRGQDGRGLDQSEAYARLARSEAECVILDNLEHAESLDTLLQQLAAAGSGPQYIIGTLTQNSGSTTDLQLRCSFRWILFAHHIEPVRGFLGRALRRTLLKRETETRLHNAEMFGVVDWVAKSFIRINKFLECHASQDATLSPNMFLLCPLEAAASRLWFINLWNLQLVPHILDSVREGLILYGRRSSWDDPLQFMLDSWPWAIPPTGLEDLAPIKPEDVGYDMSASYVGHRSSTGSRPQSGLTAGEVHHGNASGHNTLHHGNVSRVSLNSDTGEVREDPLFNMLMTLQEAANTQSADF